MKTILIIHFLVIVSFCVSAQEVISSAGETQKISGYEISWTIGEPVIETISAGTIILTQGFHQSKLTITPATEFLFSDIELKVYPNPTNEFITIYINKIGDNLNYFLYDLAGKLLETKPIITTETKLLLQTRSSGTYILKVQRDEKETLQTFKIIKN